MPAEPRWIAFEETVAINEDQIVRHGGLAGIRDENLIHSALAKPQFTYAYGDQDDLIALAVELCVALARNHGFLDGNKRTAFVAMAAFLEVNGFRLDAPDDLQLGKALEAVLTRDLDEDAFADRVAPFVRELDRP